jgi:threonine dehydratase
MIGRMRLVTLDEVRAAVPHVARAAVRTPLLPCTWAPGLWLKPENLQPVGAFKIRGAVNALAALPPEARAAGVITHSSGNHGQALGYAGQLLGAPVTVVVPENAPTVKVEAMRGYGARLVLVPPAERFARTQEIAVRDGLTIIPPFDHPAVIAGQGTVGLEIVEDLPGVAAVLVPVGGGGLASGVATAVKALSPKTLVIGVEPELAADAAESLRVGALVSWPVEHSHRTVADGVRIGLSELTFEHLRERLDGVLTVTDDVILSTVGRLATAARLVAEPSGAVATAAYLQHRGDLPDGPIVAVVSGGNIEAHLLAWLLR